VGGKPLVHWVLEALSAAAVDGVIAVVGFGKDEVISKLPTGVLWVEQSPQLGTGHAVVCARPFFSEGKFPAELAGSPVIVTCGDMPLLMAESFRKVAALREEQDAACCVLTVEIPRTSSFGRIIRGEDGSVQRIVEYKDASEDERAVLEGNTGVYCFREDALWSALEKVGNRNSQGEYYLTDVIPLLLAAGEKVVAVKCAEASEALGVNTPDDLAQVERVLKERSER
jgi:bifunctional UDP-N-acetylglucosamine pyrophosphorylase/glucosamine-1-phosphate N-acetyltransferase